VETGVSHQGREHPANKPRLGSDLKLSESPLRVWPFDVDQSQLRNSAENKLAAEFSHRIAVSVDSEVLELF